MERLLCSITFTCFLVWALLGCSGGSSGSNSKSPVNQDSSSTETTFTVSGHIGAPSLANADVAFYDRDMSEIARLSSNTASAYSVDIPAGILLPFSIIASGGNDLTTTLPASYDLLAQGHAANDQVKNVSPITTLIAEVLECTNAGVPDALNLWMQTRLEFSLGLNATTNPLSDPITVNNAAEISRANEALREIVRRTTRSMRNAGLDFTQDDVLKQIACDLGEDSLLNGIGPDVNIRLIATLRAVEAAVLLELVAGNLTINFQDGSSIMNATIATVTGLADSVVENIEPTQVLISQAQKASSLFIDDGLEPELRALASLLDGPTAVVTENIAAQLDSNHQNALWGLPDRIALADTTRIDQIWQNMGEQPQTPGPQPPTSDIAPPVLNTTNSDFWQLPGHVNDSRGGFADCGPLVRSIPGHEGRTMLRSPEPTEGRHATDSSTNNTSLCALPNTFANSQFAFPNFPSVDIFGQDKLIYLNLDIQGDLEIRGTRIEVHMVNDHTVSGRVCMGANSQHISFNGSAPPPC